VAPLLFSAAGWGIVLTIPVCAFYCPGKGYASHCEDYVVENVWRLWAVIFAAAFFRRLGFRQGRIFSLELLAEFLPSLRDCAPLCRART
jgi:hypothetical protein